MIGVSPHLSASASKHIIPHSSLAYCQRTRQVIVAYLDRSIAFYDQMGGAAYGTKYTCAGGFWIEDSPTCLCCASVDVPQVELDPTFHSGMQNFGPRVSSPAHQP
jgi:hypothetical protein